MVEGFATRLEAPVELAGCDPSSDHRDRLQLQHGLESCIASGEQASADTAQGHAQHPGSHRVAEVVIADQQ